MSIKDNEEFFEINIKKPSEVLKNAKTRLFGSNKSKVKPNIFEKIKLYYYEKTIDRIDKKINNVVDEIITTKKEIKAIENEAKDAFKNMKTNVDMDQFMQLEDKLESEKTYKEEQIKLKQEKLDELREKQEEVFEKLREENDSIKLKHEDSIVDKKPTLFNSSIIEQTPNKINLVVDKELKNSEQTFKNDVTNILNEKTEVKEMNAKADLNDLEQYKAKFKESIDNAVEVYFKDMVGSFTNVVEKMLNNQLNLENEKENLAKDNQMMKEENAKLTDANNTLKKEKEDIRVEKETLLTEKKTLETTNSELKDENTKMKEENANLKAELEKIKNDLKSYSAILTKLTSDIGTINDTKENKTL